MTFHRSRRGPESVPSVFVFSIRYNLLHKTVIFPDRLRWAGIRQHKRPLRFTSVVWLCCFLFFFFFLWWLVNSFQVANSHILNLSVHQNAASRFLFFPLISRNHLLALAIKAFNGSLHLNNKWHYVELLEKSNIALGGRAGSLHRHAGMIFGTQRAALRPQPLRPAGWYFPLLSCLFKKLQIWSVGRRWLSLAVKPLSFPSLHRRSWRRWSLVGRSSTRCWSPPRPFWLSTPSRNRRRPWPTGKVLHTSDSVPTANICLIRRLTRVNARVHGVGAVSVKLDLIRCIICCRTSGKASVCRLITQDLSTQINIQPHWFSPLWCVV